MQGWLRMLIRFAVALILLLMVAYFSVGYLIYTRLASTERACEGLESNRPDAFAISPNWPAFDVTPYQMSPYEEVTFPSRQGGLDISGWWVEKYAGAPAVILVHGGDNGCKRALDVLIPAGMLWRNGFSVLLLDVRDVGDSEREDGRSSIGNEEYLDVLGGFDWLVGQENLAARRIGLFGNSLGGATALYAFSAEPRLPALFLQSTFGNLQQVIRAELARNHYPTYLAPGAMLMARVLGGEDLTVHDPLTAIRSVGDRPVYIVHSRDDTRISITQSEQLAAAGQAAGVNVTTWFLDGAEHVRTPAVYPEEFERRLVEFFRQTLGD